MFNLYKELFLKERNFIIISLFLLIFLTLVFNPKLAMVYGLFIMVIYICKRDYNFPIKLKILLFLLSSRFFTSQSLSHILPSPGYLNARNVSSRRRAMLGRR